MKTPVKIALFVAVPLVLVVAAGVAVGWLFDASNAASLYVKVDNACIAEGGAGTSTNEDYEYRLTASDADGRMQEIAFGAARELREGAYLKVETMPLRGVIGWEEVPAEGVPAAAREALDALG